MNEETSSKPPKSLVGELNGLLTALSLSKRPIDAHIEILAGFSYDVVTKLSRLTQTEEITICQLANVSHLPHTKHNTQENNVLSVEQSVRLYIFIRILITTLRLFNGDVPSSLHWLNSPSRALGNESPIKMLSTPPGVEAVMDLIGQIEHGVTS